MRRVYRLKVSRRQQNGNLLCHPSSPPFFFFLCRNASEGRGTRTHCRDDRLGVAERGRASIKPHTHTRARTRTYSGTQTCDTSDRSGRVGVRRRKCVYTLHLHLCENKLSQADVPVRRRGCLAEGEACKTLRTPNLRESLSPALDVFPLFSPPDTNKESLTPELCTPKRPEPRTRARGTTQKPSPLLPWVSGPVSLDSCA